MMWAIFVVVIFMLFNASMLDAARKPLKKIEPKPKPKPVRYNVDILPSIQNFLEAINLSKYLLNFVRMGAVETHHLLRLSDMDYRIMLMEWDISEEEVKSLREKLSELHTLAILADEVERPEYKERAKLKYGRVLVPGSVQSYEYNEASFGASPPIGPLEAIIGNPELGCEPINVDLTNKIYIIKRGDCTFLQKAANAKAANATALLIVNNDDQVESPSSGLGIFKNITEESVLSIDPMSIVSTANTTWAKFESAAKLQPLSLQIVPLKCPPGGKCAPVIEEEKSIQAEVSSGTIEVEVNGVSRSFDFLTSTFGSILPHGAIGVTLASDLHACNDTLEGGSLGSFSPSFPIALLTHRGVCRFDVKAFNVQKTGAVLQIVVDTEDNALQRLGGMAPESGYVGIASIMVPLPCGEFVAQSLQAGHSVIAKLHPAVDATKADAWIDAAYVEWEEAHADKLMQLEGLVQKFAQGGYVDIVAWLRRKEERIRAEAAVHTHDGTDL